MPSLTLPITADGVIIEALISQAAVRQRAYASVYGSAPAPDLRKVRLAVDTGSLATFLNPDIIQAFGLQQRSLTRVHTADSGDQTLLRPAYLAALMIPLEGGHLQTFDPLLITQCNVQGQGIDGLLGCDVLNTGRLVWDGATLRCTLSF